MSHMVVRPEEEGSASWKRWIWPAVALVLSLGAGLGADHLGCAGRIEDSLSDRLHAARARPAFSQVRFVSLGQAFQEGNRFDWDDPAQRRAKCAELARAIDNAFAHGARVVVLDKWLGRRADVAPVGVDRKGQGGEPPAEEAFSYCTPRAPDDPLYRVLAKHASKIVLTAVLETGATGGLSNRPRVRYPVKRLRDLPGLQFGAVNLQMADGVVRRVPACVKTRASGVLCGLGVQAALLARGLKRPAAGRSALAFGDRRVALRRGALAFAAHRFPEPLPLSFVGMNLADPKLPAEVRRKVGDELRRKLKDRLVFIGLTNPCLCTLDQRLEGDLHPTPYGYLPGLEIQANVAATLLSGRTLDALPLWAVLLIATVLAVLGFAIGRYLSLHLGLLLFVGLGALAAVGIVWIRYGPALYMPLVGPLVTAGTAFIVGVVVRVRVEGLLRLRLYLAFRHYLSPDVIRKLLKDPSSLRLGGERQIVTLLFSDIRGFTAISEARPPEQLTAFINEYFTVMTDAVTRNGGYLDKYIGDGIMALFGAPVVTAQAQDQAQEACRAALDMASALSELNERWKARGLPEVRIGVGVNTGEAIVGNMGAETRFNYTAFGDSVNLAARLEGLNKTYGTSLLVGSGTRELCGDAFRFREVDAVRVKGRDQPERVYELLVDVPGAPAPDVAQYEQALGAYRQRDFATASARLQQVLATCPQDGPSRELLERVQWLEQNPPPEDWDGVWTMQTK